MKTHFGFMENYGDYESPCWGTEGSVCGYDSEEVCENTVDDWDMVDCKKCLAIKDKVIAGEKADEKEIVRQMGEMADFMEKEQPK